MLDCLHDSYNDGQRQDDVQNQGQQEREKREELVDDLADCLEQLQDDSDVERIDRILEEIEQLGPAAPDFDVEQSLAEFYRKYGYLFSEEPSAGQEAKPKRRKSFPRIARTVAIVAALLIICLGVAQAAGFNLMSIFPWWNGEQFHFAREENSGSQTLEELPDTEMEFESLQDALDKYGVQVPLAPSKLPDGAVLQTLSVEEEDGQPVFLAKYELPNGKLFITIGKATEVPFSDIETDKDNMEIYVVDGIEYRIMDDVRSSKAIWYNGIWECRITGNVDREEIVAMIDSIYQ